MSRLRPWPYLVAALAACTLVWVAMIPVTVPVLAAPVPPLLAGGLDHLSERIPQTAARPVGEIDADTQATQEFPASTDTISAVGLLLSTYGRSSLGEFDIILEASVKGVWKRLATHAAMKYTLQDTQFFTVEFSPPLHVATGQLLRLSLAADGDISQAISWWSDPGWQPAGYTLSVNGDGRPGTGIFLITTPRSYDHLFRALGPIWHRGTVFLSPYWKLVLALALCASAIGLLFAGTEVFRASG